jgi:transposase
MREEPITLSAREQKRAWVLTRVLAGQWTQQEAATTLDLSVRQVRRLQAAYAREGVAALVHGNRGRAPAHSIPETVREQVVTLARTTYAGFNHQHLTEKLQTEEHLAVSRPTVRRLLLAAGLGSPRPRRAPKHRRRRERMAQAGMLLQADGSRHRWLGPDGPYFTLVGGIDDATGTVPWAVFREQEDAQGYMEWLRQVLQRAGIPLALYVDRHGIFRRQPRAQWTLDEELAGGPLPTQFGRVLEELAITRIDALSPQAKGRVERLWGTFQDRLCSELRLARARTLADANRVLWAYLPTFNARFAVPAAVPDSAYRPLPPDFAPERVFCFKYARRVAADNTIQWQGARLQLLPGPDRLSYARAQVAVHEHLDGALTVWYHDRRLATRPAPAEAPLLRARSEPRPASPLPQPGAALPPRVPTTPPTGAPPRPTAEHPWRRPFSPNTPSLRQKNGQTAHADRPPVLPDNGILPATTGRGNPDPTTAEDTISDHLSGQNH